jgi:rfaE bifunctional protein kinase chain/domain
MKPERLREITQRYASLRVAIVGDFCLDRYLEIDPTRAEVSIETGLPVYNVQTVRSQPGAAGTILNNILALGIRPVYPLGFAGEDGEGFELWRCLEAKAGVRLDHFIKTSLRQTFTYTKPLLVEPGKVPVELNRLDFKNWSPTPKPVRQSLAKGLLALAGQVDAIILMDQVDVAETGVVTPEVLDTVQTTARDYPNLLIIADSRRSLRDFPPVCFKMNRAEFQILTGMTGPTELDVMKKQALDLARRQGRHVFVTLAQDGILGASPSGEAAHVPGLPVRGEIDIVGAGDSVTANLAAALSAGATLREALELAMLAASIVIHQLGTTGTASVAQLLELNETAFASTDICLREQSKP